MTPQSQLERVHDGSGLVALAADALEQQFLVIGGRGRGGRGRVRIVVVAAACCGRSRQGGSSATRAREFVGRTMMNALKRDESVDRGPGDGRRLAAGEEPAGRGGREGDAGEVVEVGRREREVGAGDAE